MHPNPMVTCIMPTANRRPFVAQAIRYFLAQDYPEKELVIVDDGSDSVADLAAACDCLRYFKLDRIHAFWLLAPTPAIPAGKLLPIRVIARARSNGSNSCSATNSMLSLALPLSLRQHLDRT